jgi:hypothetical protein
VYVFRRSGAVWAQESYLKPSNSGPIDQFGSSVSLSADGAVLAVGSKGEGSNATGINGNQADNSASGSGAVYIFRRIGTAWAQESYIKASNTERFDSFGASVALSADGTTLAVGAPGEDSNATGVNGNQADNSAQNSGAVYVFGRSSGGVWAQQAYLKASNTGGAVGPFGGPPLPDENGDWFGFSVALSADGTTLVVGAPLEDSNATGVNGNQADNSASSSGAVYVFRRTTSWAQEAYLKRSSTSVVGGLGWSVALVADGTTLAAGSVGGAVHVFRRSSTAWTLEANLQATNTEPGDQFGYSVALSSSDTNLAVGAPGEDSNATGVNGNQADNSAMESGAVYIFSR